MIGFSRHHSLQFVLIILSCASMAMAAGEFAWSWDNKNVPPAGATSDAAPARPASEIDNFHWQWSKIGGTTVAAPAPTGANSALPGTPATTGAAAPSGYGELLKENLDLREKIGRIAAEREAARKAAEDSAAEVKKMEEKMATFTSTIATLEKQRKNAVEGSDAQKKLEEQLAAVEKEKEKLATDVKSLQAKLAEVAAVKPAANVSSGIQPGSDLFREQEKAAQALKEKVEALQAERQRIEKARQDAEKKAADASGEAEKAERRRKDIEAALADAANLGKQDKKQLQKLLETMPALERELSAAKEEAASKGAALSEKERSIEALKTELLRREQRVIKAEKMMAILEQARSEVQKSSKTEKRDMHFNMAVVYAKEGKFREAELEYLRALEVDPTDAGTHYNLGILYDDQLNEKQKAALHYRRYLKLSPFAADVDQVRGWLQRIEIGK